MNIHTIRLRGPWQRVKESGAGQRIRLPIDCLAGEETRLMRRFGRPGRLDEGERVWLVIAGLSGQAQVLLNQSPLALEPSLEGMRVDITQWLLRDNWLTIDWSGVESGGLKGPVWLECVTAVD